MYKITRETNKRTKKKGNHVFFLFFKKKKFICFDLPLSLCFLSLLLFWMSSGVAGVYRIVCQRYEREGEPTLGWCGEKLFFLVP